MMNYFNFMDASFSIKNIIKVILFWYVLMLLLRFFIFDYSWSPIIMILPVWIFLMILMGYNSYKIRNYIQDKYNDSEYMYVTNILSVWKKYKHDIIVNKYYHNVKRFFMVGLGVMISVPFIMILTTIH